MLSDDDDVTDLWEEVRCNRPAPSPPKPERQGAPQGPVTAPNVASRWVFATVETEDGPIVAFSPVGYFQAMGAAYDRELPTEVADVLPGYLDEVMEASFSYPEDLSEETIRQDLLQLGFTENQAFTEWVRGQYQSLPDDF